MNQALRDINNDAVGMVLTLDNWLDMAETLTKQVFADAEKMASEKDPEISAEDRKPIVFVAIPELERVLATATADTFMDALQQATNRFWGWRLDSIHDEITKDMNLTARDYPFADKVGSLLTWWDEWADRRADRS